MSHHLAVGSRYNKIQTILLDSLLGILNLKPKKHTQNSFLMFYTVL